MKIDKNEEFSSLCMTLINNNIKGGTLLNDVPELNSLDYHWFLVTMREVIENAALLEIVDDENVHNYYYIIEAELDDDFINSLTLTLKGRDDENIVKQNYIISKVDDARAPGKRRKYYVTIDKRKFKFESLLKSL